MNNVSLSFEEVVSNIKNYLNNPNLEVQIDNVDKNRVGSAAFLMHKHVKLIMDGEDQEINKEDLRDVERACATLMRIIVVETADEELKNFARSFVLLTHNWNTVAHSKSIGKYIEALNNLIDFQDTMVGTALLLRHLIKEFEAIQNFNPPSYKVARGYLEAIDKRLEEDKK